jgi:hypothetical protein
MTQALILCNHMVTYRNFIKQYGLNANEYQYKNGSYGADEVRGYHWDTPVIMLEGYEYNKNYTLEFMHYLGHRFNHIGFLSEGERWNEDISFRS